MVTVAVMGAGGKMGFRAATRIKDNPDYKALFVEIASAAVARLAKEGMKVTPQEEALKQADVVILAVPDRFQKQVAADVVPKMKKGAMVMGLDPAAAHAGVWPKRDDISYFVAHPCHPPAFSDEAAGITNDFFGGDRLKQSVVCALFQGPDKDYARGEAIARAVYAPILRMHRITVAQMALLEPALVETLGLTCFFAMREAMDEVIRMGVPEQAVKDFMYGHLRTTLAIVFDFAGFPVSDGARLAVAEAKKQIFQADWMKILKPENVLKSVKSITHSL
jgi:hypothetical protein